MGEAADGITAAGIDAVGISEGAARRDGPTPRLKSSRRTVDRQVRGAAVDGGLHRLAWWDQAASEPTAATDAVVLSRCNGVKIDGVKIQAGKSAV